MEQRTNKNKMLELIESIHQQTNELCNVSPGPYGFGVCNENDSDIGLLIVLNPNPVLEDTVFPEEIAEYEVSVQAYRKEDSQEMTKAEIRKQLHGTNHATLAVAEAALALSSTPVVATREECIDAFEQLAQIEMEAAYGKPEETQGGLQGPLLG